MLLREELLKNKNEIEKQTNFRNEMFANQTVMIANEMYNKGMEGLVKSIIQGKTVYDIELICGREAREDEIQWTRYHYDAVPLISQMAINNGIDFVYENSPIDVENCKYCFALKEYKKNHMSRLYKGGKKEKYFKYEATLYQELKQIDTIENGVKVYQKTILSINKKDRELYYDAFNNAMYRLGFDEVEPTYTKYCKTNYCDLRFQTVHNCTEILHNVNKEKRINKGKDKLYIFHKNL